MNLFAAMFDGGLLITGVFIYAIALLIPIFLLVLAWRAVKALEASARAQHDAVVALRSIANSQSKENQ